MSLQKNLPTSNKTLRTQNGLDRFNVYCESANSLVPAPKLPAGQCDHLDVDC